MKVISRTPVIVDNKAEIQEDYISPANGMGEYATTHKAYVDDYTDMDAISSSMDPTAMDLDGNGEGEYQTVHREDGEWSNLDGKSSKVEILAFQKYVQTAIHPNAVKLNGRWDLKTKRAWKRYGRRFEDWKTKNVAGVTDPNNVVNPNGPGGTERNPSNDPNLSNTDPSGRSRAGAFWDKTQNAWQKAESTGTLDFLRGFLSGDATGNTNQNWDGGLNNNQPYQPTPLPNQRQGMSKGMKIGLAVGGVVLLGTIIYFATKPKAK